MLNIFVEISNMLVKISYILLEILYISVGRTLEYFGQNLEHLDDYRLFRTKPPPPLTILRVAKQGEGGCLTRGEKNHNFSQILAF